MSMLLGTMINTETTCIHIYITSVIERVLLLCQSFMKVTDFCRRPSAFV